jgi:hypothetical protein
VRSDSVRRRCEHVFVTVHWTPPDPGSYSHLFGLYLGDEHLARYPRTYRLVITCDAAYPVLIDECRRSVTATGLARRVRVQPDPGRRCSRVMADSKRWPEALPQHGPGRKHERKIELADWQREIVDRFPREFLRGLLHSDGCRTVNRFKTRLPSGRVAEYALSALVLLEPVGRHPGAVLRVLRAARDPLDAVQSAEHLDLAPRERRARGFVRAGEGVIVAQCAITRPS